MFKNEESVTNIFKATEITHAHVLEIIGQETQGLFVFSHASREVITLQSVQNIGFSFPHWERMGEYKTISVHAFLRRVASLEPEEK
ncbi:MAG: hypothetical protein EOM19_06360 [Candidatus Moranbacteria bacterium]|nr:hypothetical protein [Candidatus Moranbacteria bacterium]